MKKALIFGVTGQDGSYLAELLLELGYEVHGVYRKTATGNTKNIQHLISDDAIFLKTFYLHRGDLLDVTSTSRIINEVRPSEIYNEADQDHVAWSYDMVGYSSEVTAAAVSRLLEIIRLNIPDARYFQPVSSNMFGISSSEKQNESSLLNPQSPYAIAKTFAFYMTRHYRETYGLHASAGILFNHESPRRSAEYVTRKISKSVARIALGKQKNLVLGDLSAKIDWGYAKEYMKAAWMILQQEKSGDYVIGTGKAHSVQDFVNEAFAIVDLDPKKYVESSSKFLRPSKTSPLIADTSKAEKILGFRPVTAFKDLVKLMVEADLEEEKLISL